jgi:hypothetical protein
MVHGDALFIRDIRPEKEEILRDKKVTRILKLASLFEVYGLSDCAVELLEEYRSLVETVMSLDTILDALVPDHYGTGLTYRQYLEAYRRHVGRAADGRTGANDATSAKIYLPEPTVGGGAMQSPGHLRVTLSCDRPLEVTLVPNHETFFPWIKRVIRRTMVRLHL